MRLRNLSVAIASGLVLLGHGLALSRPSVSKAEVHEFRFPCPAVNGDDLTAIEARGVSVDTDHDGVGDSLRYTLYDKQQKVATLLLKDDFGTLWFSGGHVFRIRWNKGESPIPTKFICAMVTGVKRKM
jgi:hypothetical protein